MFMLPPKPDRPDPYGRVPPEKAMILTKIRPTLIIFIACVAPITAPASEGAVFHAAQYGYNLEVPPGWIQIPQDVIQTMVSAAFNPSRAPPIYDAGFQPASGAGWFEYPYVLVQVLPYAKLGSSRQINEDEFPQFISKLTGIDVGKVVDSTLSSEAKSLLGKLDMGQAQLDKKKRRFLWPINANVSGIGPLRGLVVGHFGRESIVQIAFYCRAADWDHYAATNQEIVDSFRFDATKDYSVEAAIANPSQRPIWSGVGEKALAGAIAGAVLGAIGAIGAVLAKLRKAKPPVKKDAH
jgi:hypothetical protein